MKKVRKVEKENEKEERKNKQEEENKNLQLKQQKKPKNVPRLGKENLREATNSPKEGG